MGLFGITGILRSILPGVIQRDHRAGAGGLAGFFSGKLGGLFGAAKSSFSQTSPIGKALGKVAQEKKADIQASYHLGLEAPIFDHAPADGGFLGDLVREVAERE